MKRLTRIFAGMALLIALPFLFAGQFAFGFLWIALSAAAISSPAAGCGVNTLGTLQGELILRRALEMVFTKRPILKRISMGLRDIDTGAVIANFNQTVRTRIKAIATPGNFGDAADPRADVDVPITLNRFRQVYHTFTVQEYSATNRDLVEESAEPIAIAIANDIVDDIATLWTPANFPGGKPAGDTNAPGTVTGTTTVGGGWNFTNTLVPIDSALADRGVAEDYGKFFAMNTAVYAGFLSDTQITAPLYNPDNQSAVMRGVLPEVLGFGLMRYPALPGNGVNLIGFAGSPASTVFASRAPKNPEEILKNVKYPGALSIITEEVTGFSVMATQWIDQVTLSANTRLIWMSGKAVGNKIEGQCLTSV